MTRSTLRPISDVARRLGLGDDDWEPYGRQIAKVDPGMLARPRTRPGAGKLVLVSAITPTPAGEGKTTTAIGLAQAFARIGESACLALREPSLGPCMGMKGGATGGGLSRIEPTERINLHFTGDFHAITAANNLLAAMLDNHIYFGNELGIDPRRVLWRRCMDMNDRALRRTVIGLGGYTEGVPRETGFDITAASEVMAALCLAADAEDLRHRLDRILVAFTYDNEPVTAAKLRASGAMLALLADAIKPNLVQTVDGVPAFVHGGPFANIAHGCNSVIATKLALHLSDWAITEAGFAFDLGAEKFFDIKCRVAGLDPVVVVLVVTVRALKYHGGVSLADLERPDVGAVERGLPNLEKHIESIHHFGKKPVIALNRFGTDAPDEIDAIAVCCRKLGAAFAVSDHFAHGGAGAEDLARAVMSRAAGGDAPFAPLYPLDAPLPEKVLAVARKMYGAREVVFTKAATRDLADIRRLGYEHLPVCIAKTQNSLSDDPKLKGRPQAFEVTIRGLQINAGAGFIVVLTGDILRMPGLPRKPLAEGIDLANGEIRGLR